MSALSISSIHETAELLGGITGSDFVRLENGETLIVSPADTKQVSDVLTFAHQHQVTVCPMGNGTKRHWGAGVTPRVYVSLARLNRVIEHPWQDLTCTVQAGCTWSMLQQTLAKHSQFVALDPLFPDLATVGGILATNDSGVLRHRYGSLRDLVIGMTLVLSDGTIARTGGKVVKNVAGYDLSKLLTGSLGTLAIITEANFRLHSLPQHTQSFTVVAQKASRLASLLATIRASHLLAQSLQVCTVGPEFHLNIKLNAHPEAHQEAVLAGIVKVEGLTLEKASEKIWNAREVLFTPEAAILSIATLPAQVCDYADNLQLLHPDLEICSVSQATGLHCVALHGPPEKIEDAVHKLRTGPAYLGSSVSVLQAGLNVEVAPFEIPTTTLQLMKALKHQFDPRNILSPGKFFTNA